jgi:hypothetical protein
VTSSVLLCACLRAPIEGEGFADADAAGSSTDAMDATDGLGMTGPIAPDAGGDAVTCHASYVPCLPIVDDLDCDEVHAMDAAPVEVIGDDAYGLDADHDGIGCEG